MLTARVGASLTLDRKRGRLVLFGGHDGGWRNDAWLFDGGRWTPGPSAPPALEGRLLHASAYLASRDRVVVFGGASQREEYLSDTWEYDGTGWTAGPAAPPAMVGRNGHGMAYDAARQRIVLFGGFHSLLMPSAYLSDTWEYDGFAWSGGPAPPPGMSGRSQFGMAFDERRGRTVVAAGGAGPGVFLDDVWEYDGAAWTPGVPPPAGLTPRYGLRMAWDDASGSIVLFGGNDGVYKNDTWAYDGATWSAGPTAPAGLLPRDGHAMARLGGALVLFGGYTPSTQSSLADEWEYVAPSSIVAGRGPGPTEANEVRVFAATGAYSGVGFLAYAAGGRGVNVASGDVGESGRGEILTAPGPGPTLGPHVRAFRGDGSAIAKVSFFAYGTLRYGANVTGARADGDGYAEIVTGAGYGPPFGPHVRGFDYDGTTLRPISAVSFFAYGTLRYGANVAGGDVDVDAFDELLTGPGPGPTFGPQVRGFDYDGFQIAPIAGLSFMAFATSAFGARVASGDVEGDGPSEIVAATGPGIPPSVAGFSFDGTGVAPLPGFTTTGGGMDLADIDADGDEDLIAGDGVDPAATSALRLFTYDGTQLAPALSFTPFPGSTGYGANAAGAVLGF
ncbi:MAG: kelch repeat-containing protein [Acidobacteriota bacterium]